MLSGFDTFFFFFCMIDFQRGISLKYIFYSNLISTEDRKVEEGLKVGLVILHEY